VGRGDEIGPLSGVAIVVVFVALAALMIARRLPALLAVPAEAGNEPRSWLAVVTGTGAGAAAIPHTVQYPLSMMPPQPACVQVAGTAGTAEAGTGAVAAAIPHTAQYPPSIVPPQPGCVHCVAATVIAAASARSAPRSPADSASPPPPRPQGRTAPSTAGRGPADSAR